jgi:hypothetical protein
MISAPTPYLLLVPVYKASLSYGQDRRPLSLLNKQAWFGTPFRTASACTTVAQSDLPPDYAQLGTTTFETERSRNGSRRLGSYSTGFGSENSLDYASMRVKPFAFL